MAWIESLLDDSSVPSDDRRAFRRSAPTSNTEMRSGDVNGANVMCSRCGSMVRVCLEYTSGQPLAAQNGPPSDIPAMIFVVLSSSAIRRARREPPSIIHPFGAVLCLWLLAGDECKDASHPEASTKFILVRGVRAHLGASAFDSRAENETRRTSKATERQDLKRAFELN